MQNLRGLDTVVVSKAQIEGLLEEFAKTHPEIKAHLLAERIFQQWQHGPPHHPP
jgi:hypothetical protein